MAEEKKKGNSPVSGILSLGAAGVRAAGEFMNYYASRYDSNQQYLQGRMLDLQAKDALLTGADAERTFRIQGRKIIGAQRSAAAAGGFDVNQGTALDLMDQTQRAVEDDALNIRRNAEKEAIGRRLAAEQSRIQGWLTMKQGKAALLQGLVNSGLQAGSALAGMGG